MVIISASHSVVPGVVVKEDILNDLLEMHRSLPLERSRGESIQFINIHGRLHIDDAARPLKSNEGPKLGFPAEKQTSPDHS